MKRGFSGNTKTLLWLALLVVLFSFSADGARGAEEKARLVRTHTVPASRVINRDYFAIGPLVEISGTVNGDVYAFAGQVLIDGTVNGDVLVTGGRVSISGRVAQDVRVAGGQVSLSGNLGRNLTVFGGNVDLTRSAVIKGSMVAAGGNIHLGSPLGGSAKVAAGSLIISNRVDGNVDAVVGTLRITSKAEIAGNVNYVSRREASVDEAARIGGKVTRTAPPAIPRPSPEKVVAFIAVWSLFIAAISFVSTLLLGLLSVRFLPRYHASAVAVLRRRPWASLGIGFIAAVVTPVASGLLLATVFAVPIGLIVGASYLILLYWGRIFAISWLGEAILRLFRASLGPAWTFILGLVVYFLLALIPLIGWLVILLVVLFGLGAELMVRKDVYVAARQQEII